MFLVLQSLQATHSRPLLHECFHVELECRARVIDLKIGQHGRMQHTQGAYDRVPGRSCLPDVVDGRLMDRRTIVDGRSTTREVGWIYTGNAVSNMYHASAKK